MRARCATFSLWPKNLMGDLTGHEIAIRQTSSADEASAPKGIFSPLINSARGTPKGHEVAIRQTSSAPRSPESRQHGYYL